MFSTLIWPRASSDAGVSTNDRLPTHAQLTPRLAAGRRGTCAGWRTKSLGLNTASRLRAGKRSRPTVQTMLAIEREFGWPVAEQVGAAAEGRYTREIDERVFQTEEGAA